MLFFRVTIFARLTTKQIVKKKAKYLIFDRLEKRSKCTVEEFTAALALRAAKYGQAPMKPDGSLDAISPGTYFLEEINDKHHRKYVVKK